MNPTYTVKGADGREYGPVSLEQITAWTREGRIMAHNEIRRDDMQHWAQAGDFIELRDAFLPSTPVATSASMAAASQPIATPAATVASNPNAPAQISGRASWFYWIAGLSLINSIISLTGGQWRFIFGLGVTEIFDAIGKGMGGAGPAVALILDLMAAGLFVLLGVFSTKGHMWAFIVGIVLFLIDAAIVLFFQQWLSAAVHAYVLFRLFQGMMATRELKAQSTLPT
jgi:GYF domain 2